ncbi:MAG TPA: PEP-CTERM sorting domain-containing protein [Caldimonas sp.]|jgi:hypothetical protein|nr:PEP-CTERM sorting domain-containing protein [Caldimonas sp.]
MKLLPVAAAVALLASSSAFAASSFLVDFERSWDYANGDVNGYYAGGTAADGASGSNLGVSFVNVSGLSNDASFTYYTGAPSMLGTAYAHTFSPEDRAFMNVAGGVDSALSFFYSSPLSILGAVRAYSGLNGTGTLLGTFNLAANASNAYDAWTPVTFAFSGLARSFDLTGGANVVGIDNISAAVTAVPEPSTVMLMLAGGAAMLRVVTRRRKNEA